LMFQQKSNDIAHKLQITLFFNSGHL